MKKNVSGIIIGLLLVCGGIIFIGNGIFDWHIEVFFDGWWTLFIIIPALVSLFSNGPRVFNVVALIVGTVLLLGQQDLIEERYFGVILVGVIIVGIGVTVIFGAFKKPQQVIYSYQENDGNINYTTADGSQAPPPPPRSHSWSKLNVDSSNKPSYTAIFSGVGQKCISADFEGADASAVFGGVDLDLSEVVLNKDITVNLTAVFGGVDVIAPRNVRITINKTNIFGGTDCSAISAPPDANVPVCHFVTSTVFGGIDIY